MQTDAAIRWMVAILVLPAGCLEPLEAPSAYLDERFLCGPEHAAQFDVLIAACRENHLANRSCAGIASLKGELDGQAFVVDTTLHNASYQYDEIGPMILWSATALGKSPYFAFRFSTAHMTTETTPEGLTVCRATASASIFSVDARGASHLKTMNVRSCEVERRATELHFALSAGFVGGGSIDSCLHVFEQATAP